MELLRVLILLFPWIVMFFLAKIGVTGDIIKTALGIHTNRKYCADFNEYDRRIEKDGVHCIKLFGPWLGAWSVCIATMSSFLMSSVNSANPTFFIIGVTASFTALGLFYKEIKQGRVLSQETVVTYTVMASFLTSSYYVLVTLI